MNSYSCNILLIIPHELLSLVLNFLDISSVFSLKATSKQYKRNKIIRSVCSGFDESFYSTMYRKITIGDIRYDTIQNGHTNLLKWLVHENEKRFITKRFVDLSIENGHLEIVKYIHKIGIYLNSNSSGYTGTAIVNGQISVLKYLREIGCPMDECAYDYAAFGGHLEMVQYLYDIDIECSRTVDACYYAAKNGHLEVLKCLHRYGFCWNKHVCYAASDNGHLEILKYLHENGCSWDNKCYVSAAKRGYLDILKYLHENGCPWNEFTCHCATANGHLDILQYLHENGCPG